jgi:hypothetical protein
MSAEFPLGVNTLTFSDPGPEITPVVSITFSCSLLFTVALRGLPLITTWDDETK